MYAGHCAHFSGPVGAGFGVADGATLGLGLAGGGVGTLIEAGALGACDDVPAQAARNAPKPASADPFRKARRPIRCSTPVLASFTCFPPCRPSSRVQASSSDPGLSLMTNEWSGDQVSTTSSPGAQSCALVARSMFCSYTVS